MFGLRWTSPHSLHCQCRERKSTLDHHSSDLSEVYFRMRWTAAQTCPFLSTMKWVKANCRHPHRSVLWTPSTEPRSSALKNFINHQGISAKNGTTSADISLQMFPPADQWTGGQQRRTTALSHQYYTCSLSVCEKEKEGLSQFKPSAKISKGVSETPNSCLIFP